VGTVVRDKWQIDALIGVGGMAAVYSATHRNGRRAALKILHAEYSRDANLRDRFLREGYVGNKIPHPGRVECLDNDITEDGSQFLVMELLEGETLDQIWKRLGRKVPVAAALNIAEQLLDFLAACHSTGIIHRDLKPANVFVTNERMVKVLDFGIAQLREGQTEHTRAGTTLGTPAYMSPEQARGLGDQLDGRSDLFSVGAMLYALLSGTRLHKGRTNDEALIMAATQPAPSLARVAPDLPVDVIALIDKSLAWDRRNRFTDAQDMRKEVLRILQKMGAARQKKASVAPPASGIAPTDLDVEDVSAEAAELVGEEAERSIGTPASLVDDNHPDVERLRGVFKQLERLLPVVRQYSWSHPETERKLRGAFEEIVNVLAATPTVLYWSVRPYSFAHRGREVWEPTTPLDTIPYALFEAGLRTMRLTQGITEAELRSLVGVMLLDPQSELAPEDDLSTVLWELSLPHVEVEVADGFAEGGAAQREAFYEESGELEKLAEKAANAARAEAKAMAVSTERQELQASGPATPGLDPTVRMALSSQLALPTDRWTERYIDVLVEAVLETRRAGDAPLVTTPLGLSCADLVVAGRTSLVLTMHKAIMDVLEIRSRTEDERDTIAAELTNAMLGGQTFQLLLRALGAMPDDAPEKPAVLEGFSLALGRLGVAELPRAIHALATIEDAKLREAILAYVERVGVGHERALAQRLPEWPTEVSRAILGVLVRMRTPAANQILVELTASPDLVLRLEAIAMRAGSPEQLRTELGKLADHERPDVRLAALRAMAQHKVKDCGPQLVRRIEDPNFHDFPLDERREVLRVLYALNPARAETLLVDMLGQRQMLKSEARDQTRVIASQLLGENARSREALEALMAAAKGWWGTSEALKSAATTAAKSVEQRMRSGGER